MKAVFANLGFILQFAGLLMTLPIIAGFYFNEINALISFFITAFSMFAFGFILNAVAERKALDLKSSSILVSLTFFIIGFLGAIPYIYLNVFNDSDIISILTDSYFESISGFTTTGFSLIKDLDSLPRSLIFYRSLTHWIGGIGVVFIFLVFFYPETVIERFGRSLGIEKIGENLKKTFISILLVYSVFILFFAVLFYLVGLSDFINSLGIAFGSLMTGGFSPVNDLTPFISFPFDILMIFMMILGATNFLILNRILLGKWKKIMTSEFNVMIGIIVIFSILIFLVSDNDIISSFFHVVSASTNTGYSYMSFSSLSSNLKLIFILLMFIGGNTLSTAGGIKTLRLIILLKAIPVILKRHITGKPERLEVAGRTINDSDLLIHVLIIFLGIALIFGGSFFISSYGFSFSDSLFESTSAFSTTGLTTG